MQPLPVHLAAPSSFRTACATTRRSASHLLVILFFPGCPVGPTRFDKKGLSDRFAPAICCLFFAAHFAKTWPSEWVSTIAQTARRPNRLARKYRLRSHSVSSKRQGSRVCYSCCGRPGETFRLPTFAKKVPMFVLRVNHMNQSSGWQAWLLCQACCLKRLSIFSDQPMRRQYTTATTRALFCLLDKFVWPTEKHARCWERCTPCSCICLHCFARACVPASLQA